MEFDLTLVLEVVTFFILFFLLHRFAFRPLVQKLDERKEHIEGNLNEIEGLKKAAAQDKEDAKALLVEAKKQALVIKEEAFAYGERLKEQQQAEGRQEAERMRDKAVEDLDLYVEKVKEDLRRLSGELSFEIASKILAKEIDRKKHKQLVEESLKVLYEQRDSYR